MAGGAKDGMSSSFASSLEAPSSAPPMAEIMSMEALNMNCAARSAIHLDYSALFDLALDQLREERRYRVFADLERLAGRFPHAIWHSPNGPREVVIWCSNDYLGMAQHPKVVGAMVEAASRMGTGAGGTRNIAGTNHPLIELEHELATLHGKEAALVFTSGYVSNQTGIATIAKLLPNCLLLSDALNHNSMIEGGCGNQARKSRYGVTTTSGISSNCCALPIHTGRS